jgi:hypothetical protein
MKRDALRPTCTLGIFVLYTSVPMHQCRFLKLSRSLRFADYLPTHHICLCLSASSLREQPSIPDYPRTFSITQQCRFLTTHSQPTSILAKNPCPEMQQNPCPAVTKPSNRLSISLSLSQSNRAFNILPETSSSTQQCSRFLTTHSQQNPYPESRRHYPRQPSKSLCLCLYLSLSLRLFMSSLHRAVPCFFMSQKERNKEFLEQQGHPHHQDINPTTIQMCMCVCVCVSLSLSLRLSTTNTSLFFYITARQ